MAEFAPRLHFIFVSLVFESGGGKGRRAGGLEGLAWGVAVLELANDVIGSLTAHPLSVVLSIFIILLFQIK